jgi:hypothetical protein
MSLTLRRNYDNTLTHTRYVIPRIQLSRRTVNNNDNRHRLWTTWCLAQRTGQGVPGSNQNHGSE